MSVLVAQLGARRHYAVPLAFHSHGRLAQFCADIFLRSPRLCSLLQHSGRASGVKSLRRLAGRQHAALSGASIRTFPAFGLAYHQRVNKARTAEQRTAAWLWGGRRFCELVAKRAGDDWSMAYGFTSASQELFERARAIGATTCLDHSTAPRRYEMEMVKEEAERFPGWQEDNGLDSLIDDYSERQRQERKLADVIICASTFARNAVAGEMVDTRRVKVVPLGIDLARHSIPDRRHRRHGELRVLFVGNEGLRKGVGYLSKSMSLLNSNSITTRVIGDLAISQKGLAELRRYMKVLGQVPREEAAIHFAWADVLVLPSISDTFGLVVLEAMAAGLPVIASTHTCGPDIIREGTDGYVVPIRDPEAIANCLDRLAGDSDRLEAMSRNAIQRASDFTLERYRDRLIASVAPLTNPPGT